MSFDLFILFEKTDETTQSKWVNKLNQAGIECQFPDGFSIDSDFEGETQVECKLLPPLVKTATEFESYEFYFEPSEVDKGGITEMIASTDDVALQQKLSQVKSEVQLYSSAGRDDYALIVQCYAAATLADATDGVLFDPQEFGAVHEEKVYQVAKHHCQYELDQAKSTQQATVQDHNVINTTLNQKKGSSNSEGMSTVSVILLCILFVAIINIIMK